MRNVIQKLQKLKIKIKKNFDLSLTNFSHMLNTIFRIILILFGLVRFHSSKPKSKPFSDQFLVSLLRYYSLEHYAEIYHYNPLNALPSGIQQICIYLFMVSAYAGM